MMENSNETMKRIQRKRTKGFKLPYNTICVSRGTKWGNPFKIEGEITRHMACQMFEDCILNNTMVYAYFSDFNEGKKQFERFKWMSENIGLLEGKNLACFCSLDDECHKDVLIEMCKQIETEAYQIMEAEYWQQMQIEADKVNTI